MRRYTIAKALAIVLGALSVVARGLPERRSEINVRSPGDVGNPKQRLEELGLVKGSEGVLDGNIHTGTHSMSKNTTFAKRHTHLDIRGHSCSPFCQPITRESYPDPIACAILYQELLSTQGRFTVIPNDHKNYTREGCGFYFVNPSPDTSYTYSFGGFGVIAEWLTVHCFTGRGINAAYCVYNSTGIDSPYIYAAGY